VLENPWPLGPKLKAAREALDLSKRQAAKRAQVSEQLWRRLESGYYVVQGQRIPLAGPDGTSRGAKAETIRAVALAVDLDPGDALEIVGYPRDAGRVAEDQVAKAEREWRDLYDKFELAWGPDVARAVLHRMYRGRNAVPTETPDRPSGSTDSATG
jgi:transcriptional regulator with XRE-family HTH domain